MRWLCIPLVALSVTCACAPVDRQTIDPNSVQLPMSFIQCATRKASQYAQEDPSMTLEVLAGFANAECQGGLDAYIGGLNLIYRDRVYVTSALRRRADLLCTKIAMDARIASMQPVRGAANSRSPAQSAPASQDDFKWSSPQPLPPPDKRF